MSAHLPIDAAAAEAAPDLAAALAAAPFLPSRKTMGWTAIKQRQFLEFVALGHSVETAATMVQLSHQSAYAFRASARGAVFALGWRAALLLARDRLVDTLLTRALEGQTVTITRDDGSEVHRHYHDNRLATATLTRLDRMADGDSAAASAQSGGGGGGAVSAGGLHAARLAAQEWDSYLDLVESDAGPARAALFVACRSTPDGRETLALEPIAALARADLRLRTGVGDAAEVDIAASTPRGAASGPPSNGAAPRPPGCSASRHPNPPPPPPRATRNRRNIRPSRRRRPTVRYGGTRRSGNGAPTSRRRPASTVTKTMSSARIAIAANSMRKRRRSSTPIAPWPTPSFWRGRSPIATPGSPPRAPNWPKTRRGHCGRTGRPVPLLRTRQRPFDSEMRDSVGRSGRDRWGRMTSAAIPPS